MRDPGYSEIVAAAPPPCFAARHTRGDGARPRGTLAAGQALHCVRREVRGCAAPAGRCVRGPDTASSTSASPPPHARSRSRCARCDPDGLQPLIPLHNRASAPHLTLLSSTVPFGSLPCPAPLPRAPRMRGAMVRPPFTASWPLLAYGVRLHWHGRLYAPSRSLCTAMSDNRLAYEATNQSQCSARSSARHIAHCCRPGVLARHGPTAARAASTWVPRNRRHVASGTNWLAMPHHTVAHYEPHRGVRCGPFTSVGCDCSAKV